MNIAARAWLKLCARMNSMRFGTQVRLLFGALGVASLLSCGKGERAATGTAQTQGTARPVQVGLAVLRPMEHTITAVGTLAPQETSTLSTKVTGRIQRLDVDIGRDRQAGDLIAQIEPRDYELKVQQAAAALAEARAALGLPLDSDTERLETEAISSVKQAKAVLEEATKSVERVRRLTLAQIASASELDTAEAAYKVALTRYMRPWRKPGPGWQPSPTASRTRDRAQTTERRVGARAL